ncbi:hypothetical protein BJ170DRAFT_598765 [Xylariales sp. AK1849]|nr:hypothetical protein BJ170DRAFT_598765 [Xylariales sp. AK1849]
MLHEDTKPARWCSQNWDARVFVFGMYLVLCALLLSLCFKLAGRRVLTLVERHDHEELNSRKYPAVWLALHVLPQDRRAKDPHSTSGFRAAHEENSNGPFKVWLIQSLVDSKFG